MEIVQNRAVILRTRNPDKVTQHIPKSQVIDEVSTPEGTGYSVAVSWTLPNTKILHNLGFKKVPSPIEGQYDWPGLYKPFAHQKVTAGFLTVHQRAYCLNDMGCVDSETEYLSPHGWVKISEYAGGKVAQYHPDTGAIEFVEPEGYLKKPCADMIHFKTKYGIDQMLSPEHRMIIHDATSKIGKWVVMSAAEMKVRHDAARSGENLFKRNGGKVGFSHAATPATYRHPWGPGLDISCERLRLQVAVIADGHFQNSTSRCVVRIKKERKILRLRGLLETSNTPFTETTPEHAGAEGFHIFTFNAPWRLKEFDQRFFSCNAEQINAIYEEVLHWDGCLRGGKRLGEFTTTSKGSADFVQAVYNSKGHVARVLEDRRVDKYSAGVCYTVSIRDQKNGYLHYKSTTTDTAFVCKSTDGFKYCFTVPSSFLLFRRKGCVFASGNTGKTMSVIWAADYLLTKRYINRVLIICPLSIMDSAWRADLFRTAMHRRVDIAHGTRDKRRKVIESDAEFVIINYDGVESVQKELLAGGFDLIVCDEASALKTATTKRWKMINSLIQTDTWLWLLTGTPAAQSPTDAYGLAKMLNPKSVPSFFGAFRDKVMLKVSTFRYVAKPEAQEIVYQTLQPAIRFTKEECLDLPEMTYTERDVPMTAQQKKYYDLLRKDLLIHAAGEEVTALNAAIQMNKLLQISSGTCYADNGEVVEFDCSNRLHEMTEMIRQSSHKTLVFANFKHAIVTIKTHLDKEGITAEVIHGGVSAGKRTEIFQSFQQKPDIQVLIIQPQAASHGVTLHAANTIVWFGPITSTETYLQANARVYRAGQKNPCTVVHLIGSGVERDLYRALAGRTLAQDSLLAMYKAAIGA